MRDYRHMPNEEIIELIFTEEDRLTRTAADEIIRRSPETLPMLSEVVMDRIGWTVDLPEWWAPVHATYLIGAIGGGKALIPLLSSLRWSDAYDNEWVTEDLPTILGSMGTISWSSLVSVVNDRTAGWSARSIAMDALGSQSLRNPNREEEAMSLLADLLRDKGEEYGARRSAAFVLLDFRRANCRKELIAFAEEERARQEQYPDYRVAFGVKEVDLELSTPRIELDVYIRDWLRFYDPEEIAFRQKRWSSEKARTRPDLKAQDIEAGGGLFTVKRDGPCPCGSGKPFKRCCMGKLH